MRRLPLEDITSFIIRRRDDSHSKIANFNAVPKLKYLYELHLYSYTFHITTRREHFQRENPNC